MFLGQVPPRPRRHSPNLDSPLPLTATGSRPSSVTRRSVSAAYRADLVGRAVPFSADDDRWIATATLLEHASLVSGDICDSLVREAAELATTILGADEAARLGTREWGDRDRSLVDPIMLLVEVVRLAGAFNLAGTMLDALLTANPQLNTVQQGRVLARRARVAWNTGQFDEAADRFRHVESLGRAAKSPELRVRAWFGLGSLAQMRGNYPEVRRLARRTARVADREGYLALSRHAHYGLMIAAAAAKEFDEALLEGWIVYGYSAGFAVDEGSSLLSLGQLLLEAGHPAEAFAGFAAVVQRELPARVILPALSGLALASATLERGETLDWAVSEVLRARAMSVQHYSMASALLECATALALVERSEEAERCRLDALEMAKMHGFHEVAFRAESLDTAQHAPSTSAATILSDRAAGVAERVAWLEPERLPAHVALAVATA